MKILVDIGLTILRNSDRLMELDPICQKPSTFVYNVEGALSNPPLFLSTVTIDYFLRGFTQPTTFECRD